MVTIAAVTSAISLLETLVAFAEQRLGASRGVAALGATVAVFVAGLPSALSHGPLGFLVGGRDVLSIVDAVTSDVLLPIAGLLTALFVGWVWGVAPALAELRHGARRVPETIWSLSVRVVIPLTVVTILVAGLFGVR
jgi:NSS family neurotransmitter:Na+ symporter